MAYNDVEQKERKSGDYSLELWQSRITHALKWRADLYDREWKRAYDMFKGEHWRIQVEDNPRADEVRQEITVNVTAATVLNIVPFLINEGAAFKATPRKPESVVSAMLQESVLNYEYKKQEMQSQAEKCVYDAAIVGHGIGKTGFNLELAEAVSKADGDIVYEDYIEAEAPYFKRINPFLFLFDPNASEYNLATARWCCEIYFQYIPDILANKNWDKGVIAKIKSGVAGYTITTKDTLFKKENNYGDMEYDQDVPECQLGIMYEIWDKKYNQVLTFAAGVEEPLQVKDNPYPYLKGEFPYLKVDYIYVPNDCYGMGIPFLIDDQQFELDRHRTAAYHHRRRFNRKYEILKGMEEDSKRALAEGEDGALIEVIQSGSIRAIEDAPLSQDYQLIEALIKQDIQELTGADALLRGGQLPSRTTAGEVNARTNLFMLKLDDRIKAVQRFVLKIGKQTSAHISGNYVTEKVVKIVGAQGQFWVRYTNADIRDEVDWDMEAINAPKIDPQIERQQRLQIFQIAVQMLPLIQAQVVKINMNELVKWVLESFGMKDTGRFFEGASAPLVPLDENGNPTQGPIGASQVPVQQQQPLTPNDMQAQAGGAAITNSANGLQLGQQ